MASVHNIVTPNEFDINKITYGTVKRLDSGAKSIGVLYNGAPLVMQIPLMRCPFGLGKWENKDNNTVKYSIDLSFAGRDARPVLQRFYDNIVNLDEKFLNDAFENCSEWLGKKYNTKEVVEALYTTTMKYARDKVTKEITDKYPPTFKTTIPLTKEGSFACETFDNKCNPVNLLDIERKGGLKGSNISAIIQCQGIWVAGAKFGCAWKIVQMQISQRPVIRGFAIKKLEDDIGINEDDASDDGVSEAGDSVISATELVEENDDDIVESDDDDEEDNDDIVEIDDDDDLDAKPDAKPVEAEEQPKSAPKKAPVAKKAAVRTKKATA